MISDFKQVCSPVPSLLVNYLKLTFIHAFDRIELIVCNGLAVQFLKLKCFNKQKIKIKSDPIRESTHTLQYFDVVVKVFIFRFDAIHVVALNARMLAVRVGQRVFH